jgi:hypothetical protein
LLTVPKVIQARGAYDVSHFADIGPLAVWPRRRAFPSLRPRGF